MASSTDTGFLTVKSLEAQDQGVGRLGFFCVLSQLARGLCPHKVTPWSLRVRALISSYKDTGYIGLGTTYLTSFDLIPF